MECLVGIQCKDFVLVAADMTTAQSIIVMKSGKMFVIFAYPTVSGILKFDMLILHIIRAYYTCNIMH